MDASCTVKVMNTSLKIKEKREIKACQFTCCSFWPFQVTEALGRSYAERCSRRNESHIPIVEPSVHKLEA